MNTIKIDFDNRDLLSSFDDINKEVVKLEKEINNLDSAINNSVFFNDSNKIFESIESGSSIAISSIDNINNSIIEENLQNEIALAPTEDIRKSIQYDIPCVYEVYWYELGYGWDDENDFPCKCIEKKMYVEVPEYTDVGRVIYTYPNKIIHSYKQFKKYTRKKWHSISNADKEKIKEFFAKYPGGVITFG